MISLLLSIRKVCILVALLFGNTAYAQLIETEHLTDNHFIGSATYGIAFWDMYELSLYSQQKPFVEGEPPYALEIHFLKNYTASKFVDRVISQVRENDADDEVRLARWHSNFMSIFPSVANDETITAIYNLDRETHFYNGEEHLGRMLDPLFGIRFFSIWVGDESPESKVRDQLVGSSDEIPQLSDQ